jgi:hypothetical protein
MLLATIAATSALPNYKRGARRRHGDRNYFTECVCKYFPWDDISVEDDQFRTGQELRIAAAETLYDVFRCPLFHSGGLVAGGDTFSRLILVHPGHQDLSEAENRIEELAKQNSLRGQLILKIEATHCTLYLKDFYWCVRKLVELFLNDEDNVSQIIQHSV